jgi:hypothetical protein|tara:strand:+ start:45 stop:401 length:357 start_codon:yes stop_codon:yes gene_type:complete
MDYGEIDKYLKQSINNKIKQSTSPDKEMFKEFKNKIESHTIHEYKFLHYLDNIPIDEDMCDMEDNFLVSCYNEYMYQYRNNMLKPNKPIYKKNVINFIHNPFTSRMKLIRASAFGKKS